MEAKLDEKQLNKIVAMYFLRKYYLSDIIDWSWTVMEWSDSQNIRILASFKYSPCDDPKEIEWYFFRSLKDLGWVRKPQEQVIKEYYIDTLLSILAKETTPEDGVEGLIAVVHALRCPTDMNVWLYFEFEFLEDLNPILDVNLYQQIQNMPTQERNELIEVEALNSLIKLGVL
jgi:hypothetical protein